MDKGLRFVSFMVLEVRKSNILAPKSSEVLPAASGDGRDLHMAEHFFSLSNQLKQSWGFHSHGLI